MSENLDVVESSETESVTVEALALPASPVPVDESGAELDLYFSAEDMAKLQRALAKGPRRGRFGKVTDAHSGQTFMVYSGSKFGAGRVICRPAGKPVLSTEE